jgi:hypothetical protein
MSALGQKQTFAPQTGMSALPPKADICSALAYEACAVDQKRKKHQTPNLQTRPWTPRLKRNARSGMYGKRLDAPAMSSIEKSAKGESRGSNRRLIIVRVHKRHP